MRLKLQNIAIIEEAIIDINGITLIAGQNDSGKSTVGKVLYALTRGINIDENRFNFSKNDYIYNTLRSIRNLLSRSRSEIDNDKFIQEKFISNFDKNEDSYFSRKNRFLFHSFNNEKLSNELIALEDLYLKYTDENITTQLNKLIENIRERINLTIDSNEVLIYELETFFKNEFGNQIRNQFSQEESRLEIEGINKKEILFGKEIVIDGIETNSFFYDDVIFIESPILINKYLYLINSRPLFEKNDYLNSKIFKEDEIKDIFTDESSNINSFLNEINKLINGKFNFDENERLVFNKGNIDFDIDNVATGIKTFGILQLLLQKGEINSNSLLIIDEPEVHLHPTWQVKFAEILVKLSKELNIQMVLTSHSPYFIEAIDTFSKKYKFESSTNFYFAEKNKNGLSSKIANVNNSLSKIYGSISEASYNLRRIENELE